MLTIDSREAKAHPVIVSELKHLFGPEHLDTCTTLDFGDYTFTGASDHPTLHRPPTIAIELATVSDLLGKINSGRLAFQLSGMIDRYDVRILMIESAVQTNKYGSIVLPGAPQQMPYTRLAEVLFAAQSHGVIVEYASSREHVAELIHSNYKYWQKPYEQHKSFRPAQLSYDALIPLGEALDSRVSNLMGLPGIGEQKATDALDLYKSIGLIYQLPAIALRAIPGWGATTAQRVYNFIHTNVESGEVPEE